MLNAKIKEAIDFVDFLVDEATDEAIADRDFEGLDGYGEASVELDNSMLGTYIGALEALDIRYWLDEVPTINPERKYKLWVYCTAKLYGGYELVWGLTREEG